jgi:hypothetical protein
MANDRISDTTGSFMTPDPALNPEGGANGFAACQERPDEHAPPWETPWIDLGGEA